MKKLLCSIALLSCSLPCFASSKTIQIQGSAIQFKCIPSLDTIIAGVPFIIDASTMDLTNACDSLISSAQAYEDAAGASSDFQTQGDYYYNAAQAYLKACNLILITTENIGAIGDAQDITYIQSYRCSALETFNQSFESYLELCLHNINSPLAKSIATNAVLALSDFLVNLIALNQEQINLLVNLNTLPEFATFIQSYQPSSLCDETSWYPIQLPGEDTANCQWKQIKIPANSTQYSGPSRASLSFPAANPDEPSFPFGTPGQQMLNEAPTPYGSIGIFHNQGLLTNPISGTYISSGQTKTDVNNANGSSSHYMGSISNPIYDMGHGLGSMLLTYSQILDPYSNIDPNADPAIVNIIPQAQYIYKIPAPTTVQNLHDTIRDYMYSADIYKMDSYVYNSYANTIAKNTYPEDFMPAIRRMGNARMKVVECYEGAILKIFTGLTGKTNISPSALSTMDINAARTAAQCIAIILPMYNSIIQQIATYDIPLLNALSSLQSNSSFTSVQTSSTPPTQPTLNQQSTNAIANAQSVADKAIAQQTLNQQTAMQKSLNLKAAANFAQQAANAADQTTEPARFAQGIAILAAKEVASAISAITQAQQNTASAIAQAQQALASASTTTQQALASSITAAQQTLTSAIQSTLLVQQDAAIVATAVQQVQLAAATATTAAQQAQQAASTGDQKTASQQAQQAVASATTATQQSTLASTAESTLEKAATAANQQVQSAQQAAAQLAQQANAQQAATQKAALDAANALQEEKLQGKLNRLQQASDEQAPIDAAAAQLAAALGANDQAAIDTATAQLAAAQQALDSATSTTQQALDSATTAAQQAQQSAATAAAQKTAADKATAQAAMQATTQAQIVADAKTAAAQKAAATQAQIATAQAQVVATQKANADKAAADAATAANQKALADKAAADKAAANKAAADKAAANKAAANKAAADKAAADKAAADKAAADKAAADKAAADKAAADKAAADKAAADKAAAAQKQSVKKTVTKKAPKPETQPSVHNIIAELYEQYEENNPDAPII